MKNINTIGILGAGAWGTAIGKILVDAGTNCLIWTNELTIESEINNKHTNEKFCGLNILPKKLIATSSLEKIVKNCQVIILSIPTIAIKEVVDALVNTLKQLKINKKFYFISSSKGFSPNKTTITTYLKAIIPSEYLNDVGAIIGPNLATEIYLNKLTKTMLLFDNLDIAKEIAKCFKNNYFIAIPSTELLSAEYISIIKNIYALFAGMCWGLGYEYNTLGWFLPQILNEMQQILKFKNCDSKIVYDLPGLGDLLVTATNQKSRNFRTGFLLASKNDDNIHNWTSKLTVEGVNACKILYKSFNSNELKSLPIISIIYNILYNKHNIAKSLKKVFELKGNGL